MFLLKVLFYPSDQMVFECPLDKLMKYIWGQQLMDVCVSEARREWL